MASREELDLLIQDESSSKSTDTRVDVGHIAALTRQLRSTSRTISIGCSLVVVMSFACILILSVIIVFSATLTKEKKIFLGTVMGVLLLGSQVVLCVSRRDPNTLIIFSIIASFVSGLCLGLAVWYF